MAGKRPDAKSVADQLHTRYASSRGLTLIAQKLLKALFAGRSNDVAFWALAHAQFRQHELCADLQAELAAMAELASETLPISSEPSLLAANSNEPTSKRTRIKTHGRRERPRRNRDYT